MIRYHGVFAPNAAARQDVVALIAGIADVKSKRVGNSDNAIDPLPPSPILRRTRQRWAVLLKRVVASDALICPCGQPRKIIAALSPAYTPDALMAFLLSIDLRVEPLPSMPARAPPHATLDFDHVD